MNNGRERGPPEPRRRHEVTDNRSNERTGNQWRETEAEEVNTMAKKDDAREIKKGKESER